MKKIKDFFLALKWRRKELMESSEFLCVAFIAIDGALALLAFSTLAFITLNLTVFGLSAGFTELLLVWLIIAFGIIVTFALGVLVQVFWLR